MDNWENMLTHTRQNIYGRHFISSMSSDKFVKWWKWDGVLYKQTSTVWKPKRIRIFALIINYTMLMKTNPGFPGTYIQQVIGYDVTNSSGTQPRKNLVTMRKVDTSNLMMIMTWVLYICIYIYICIYMVLWMFGKIHSMVYMINHSQKKIFFKLKY